MFSKLTSLAFLAAPALVLAVDIPVTVGGGNSFTFSPSSITAAVGDTITFTVVSRNHSITTTHFSGAVCPPPVGGVGPNGFDSGFLSALDGTTPSFTYTVVDTEPHFGACMQAAGAHCRIGMTFAINPTAEQTYAQFDANARAS